MAAINPTELWKYTWELYITPTGWSRTRLASVRWLVANIDNSNVIEVKADDTGTVFKVIDLQASITCELLENMGRDTIDLLFTTTSSDVAGSLVSGATQVIASGTKAFNEFTAITNQNGSGAAITVNSVTGATDGLLVADTDYVVTKDADGTYWIVIIDSATVTTMAQNFTIDLDYTPNASENTTIAIDSVEAKNFLVEIEAVNPSDITQTRITKLSSASFDWVYNMNYADVVEAGDITGSELTFTANKGSNLIYENEIL